MNQEEIWNMCKFTLALVLIVGTAVYATHGPPPPPPKQASLSRDPSSVRTLAHPTLIYPKSNSYSGTPVVELDCVGSKKLEHMSTTTQQIRIEGSKCRAQIEELVIENATNGYQASVFETESTGFSSDYMTLNPGTNAIRIFNSQGGKKKLLAEVLVQRDY